MKIVFARREDAAALTAIAFAAKRHWGYPDSWMQHWTTALTLSDDYVAAHPTFVAVIDGSPAGFCAVQFRADEAQLDHLWVLPAAMRRGIGSALFARAEQAARERGARRLTIVGDPHAEGFYLKMGARVYGRELAAIDGVERFLPLLEKPLA